MYTKKQLVGRQVQVGCKSFTPDDVKLITEAVKSLK